MFFVAAASFISSSYILRHEAQVIILSAINMDALANTLIRTSLGVLGFKLSLSILPIPILFMTVGMHAFINGHEYHL
jgi:hypothetical protein